MLMKLIDQKNRKYFYLSEFIYFFMMGIFCFLSILTYFLMWLIRFNLSEMILR